MSAELVTLLLSWEYAPYGIGALIGLCIVIYLWFRPLSKETPPLSDAQILSKENEYFAIRRAVAFRDAAGSGGRAGSGGSGGHTLHSRTTKKKSDPENETTPLLFPLMFPKYDEKHDTRKSDDGDTGIKIGSSIPSDKIGVAFGAGGIYSAAFALGALKAFAARGVLHTVDYISAVSGGSFAASALMTELYGIARNTQKGASVNVKNGIVACIHSIFVLHFRTCEL